MSNPHDEFLIDENFTLVKPANKDKFIKIVHDNYKIEATENPMEFILSKKTTIGALARSLNISVEELLDSLEEVNK